MFEAYIKESFFMICICSGLPLVCSSISGLLVAVFQTATQVQEQTISYLTKFTTIVIIIALFGEWFSAEMIRFVQDLFSSIAML